MHGGEYGLWLRVLCLSVLEIQNGCFLTRGAEEFLFDENNFFFDYVAEQMGFDPGALRERIRGSIQRAGRDRRESWQDRIRAKADH